MPSMKRTSKEYREIAENILQLESRILEKKETKKNRKNKGLRKKDVQKSG